MDLAGPGAAAYTHAATVHGGSAYTRALSGDPSPSPPTASSPSYTAYASQAGASNTRRSSSQGHDMGGGSHGGPHGPSFTLSPPTSPLPRHSPMGMGGSGPGDAAAAAATVGHSRRSSSEQQLLQLLESPGLGLGLGGRASVPSAAAAGGSGGGAVGVSAGTAWHSQATLASRSSGAGGGAGVAGGGRFYRDSSGFGGMVEGTFAAGLVERDTHSSYAQSSLGSFNQLVVDMVQHAATLSSHPSEHGPDSSGSSMVPLAGFPLQATSPPAGQSQPLLNHHHSPDVRPSLLPASAAQPMQPPVPPTQQQQQQQQQAMPATATAVVGSERRSRVGWRSRIPLAPVDS